MNILALSGNAVLDVSALDFCYLLADVLFSYNMNDLSMYSITVLEATATFRVVSQRLIQILDKISRHENWYFIST